MANRSYPPEHRRFLPPELRAALGEQDMGPAPDAAAQAVGSAAGDVVHSRTYRFIHAAAWKYVAGWGSLLILLVLFGMMCSPVYWRF